MVFEKERKYDILFSSLEREKKNHYELDGGRFLLGDGLVELGRAEIGETEDLRSFSSLMDGMRRPEVRSAEPGIGKLPGSDER